MPAHKQYPPPIREMLQAVSGCQPRASQGSLHRSLFSKRIGFLNTSIESFPKPVWSARHPLSSGEVRAKSLHRPMDAMLSDSSVRRSISRDCAPVSPPRACGQDAGFIRQLWASIPDKWVCKRLSNSQRSRQSCMAMFHAGRWGASKMSVLIDIGWRKPCGLASIPPQFKLAESAFWCR